MPSQIAKFDTLRSLGYASISGSYAVVGTASTKRIRGICFTNDTEGSVVFSTDGVNDHVFAKSNSFKLWDIASNTNPQLDDRYVLPVGTQIYVKQLEAPVSGSVYIEFLIDA